MELTKLKRIANTGEIDPKDFPKYDIGKPAWAPEPILTLFYNTPGPIQPIQFNAADAIKNLNESLGYNKAPEIPSDFKPKLVDTTSSKQPEVEGANPNGADAAKGAGPWFALGAWAGLGALAGLNAVKKTGELLSEVGTSNAAAGGIGYTRLNFVDSSKYMDEYDSNTAKSFLTNPFEGITRLFGRSKLEEAIRQANQKAAITNNYNMGNALSQKLLLDGSRYNRNSQSLLRGFHDGRGSGFGGFGRVSSGEVLVHGNNIIERMPGLPNFKDGIVTYVGDAGVISNHKVDGVRNSDYVMATGDVRGGLIRDMFWRKEHGKEYKNGKMPGFKEGYLGNLIPSGIGMLASIGQYVDAASQDIRSPQVYSANPYEQSALNDLAGLRIDQYPIINQINNATARADHALNMSGGLSGYQRSRARTANLLNTQKSISDTLMNAQMLNNQYKVNLANAKMQLGSQQAQRMQQSRIFNEEMLAKAHAARQLGKQMGIYNFLNQLQGYYANEFKRRQFNETMDLYRQLQALDRDRFNAEFPNYGKITKPVSTANKYKVNTNLTTPTMMYNPTLVGGNIGMYTAPSLTAPKPFYYPGATFKLDSFWNNPYLRRNK